MSERNINPRILLARALAETLYWAKRCYYDGHYGLLNFGIPDEIYDQWERQLEYICPGHPVNECVGAPKSMDVLIGMAETRKLIEAVYDKRPVPEPKQRRQKNIRGSVSKDKGPGSEDGVLQATSV
jgi:hypothetical protein